MMFSIDFFKKVASLFESENIEIFEKRLIELFDSVFASKLMVCKVDSVVSVPFYKKGYEIDFPIDVNEIGNDFLIKDFSIEVFGEEVRADIVINIKYKNYRSYVVFLCKPDEKLIDIVGIIVPAMGRKAFELLASEERMKAFVGYQHKIEFIKKAKFVLSIFEEDEILSKALILFMDSFSAEASVLQRGEKYYFMGLQEEDLKNITIDGMNLDDFLARNENTVFIENDFYSATYNIENMFFVTIPEEDIKIMLFNIKYDFVPDKEFAEIISSVMKIALENARQHKRIVDYKLEEQEINHTIEILNKFSNQKINYDDKSVVVNGINIPAKMAGGDYLDFKKTMNGYYFVIADVCGKGYSASILTVVLCTFTELAFNKDRFAENLIKLNRFLCEKNLDGKFITAFIAYYDNKNSMLYYVSFGHEPAFLVSDTRIEELKSEYLPLGIFEEEYEVSKVKINSGDRLFIYSDGIVEYILYDDIKKRLKENECYNKNFVKGLYDELVKDKNTQRDDFTCLYACFK